MHARSEQPDRRRPIGRLILSILCGWLMVGACGSVIANCQEPAKQDSKRKESANSDKGEEQSALERLEDLLRRGRRAASGGENPPSGTEAREGTQQETRQEEPPSDSKKTQTGELPPPLLPPGRSVKPGRMADGDTPSEGNGVRRRDDELPLTPAENDRSPRAEALQPYLGLQVSDLTRERASALGVPVASGAVIDQVESTSPAEDAGMSADAVIVAVDGRRVDRAVDLQAQLERKQVGDPLTLLYYLGPKLARVQLRVGGIEEPALAEPGSDPAMAEENSRERIIRPLAPEGFAERLFGEAPADTRDGVGENDRTRDLAPDAAAQDSSPRRGPLRILDRLPRRTRNELGERLRPASNPDWEEVRDLLAAQQARIEQLEQRVLALEAALRRRSANGDDAPR